MREDSFFQSSEKDIREFQSFSVMNGQERNLCLLVYRIGIGDEGGMVQEFG